MTARRHRPRSHNLQQLKLQRDKLEQFQAKMEREVDSLKALARQLLASNCRDKAKLLLRKKKYQETTLARTDQQLENIERMVSDIEFAQVQQSVIADLQKGNEALRKLNQMMTLDDVEKLMDETDEAIRYQKEIGQLLAGNLTNEDEDEVEAELAQILKEASDLKLPDVPTSTPLATTLATPQTPDDHYKLPDVPNEKITVKEAPQKEAVLAS